MAEHLVGAGYPLTVHSRSQPPVDQLVAAGARRAVSGADVAAAAEVVITMLPDTPDVEAVLFGSDGVVSGASAGSLVVDMSTIDPGATRSFADRLAGHGIAMVDAPVSGGQRGALEATLAIMVGGAPDDVARAMPLFEVMGSSVVHVGPLGAGQVCKACNQLVVASTIEAVAEALALAERSGVDASKVRQALSGGFAGSRILEVHGERMLNRMFEPGFKVRLQAKDARIVLRAASEVGLDLPGFAPVARQLKRLATEGGGELDHSALFAMLDG
jgi:2-hydroxy-3-oxopropionate reductase